MIGKIIAAVVVIILIAGGGAYWYMHKGGTSPAPAEQTATPTPQVAGQDATVGTGKTAEPNKVVSVLYVGMLQDGTVFDSSEANGGNPTVFVLGEPGIIPGFQIGVNGMKEGGERRISVPPELGYGGEERKDASGKVIIPANSTIVFDLKLIKVEDASTTPKAAQ